MSCLRLVSLFTLSLGCAVVNAASGRADDKTPPAPASTATTKVPGPSAGNNSVTCAVYSLVEFGDDPQLGQWIADTIPQVIEPGSWRHAVAAGHATGHHLSYFAPARILVVHHTPGVQAQVDAFLKRVKQALPPHRQAAKGTTLQPLATTGSFAVLSDRNVVPAHHAVAPSSKPSDPVLMPKGVYPVPAPLQQPKHLFHLVLRYEGEGVVDAQVVELLKNVTGQNPAPTEKTDKAEPAKSSQHSSLFNFIIRYEGDGIIDANVLELFKCYLTEAGKSQTWSSPAKSGCALSTTCPPAVLQSPSSYGNPNVIPSPIPQAPTSTPSSLGSTPLSPPTGSNPKSSSNSSPLPVPSPDL
ncbi:MAG: hypothetical protein L0Y72_05080 [Gemmataceae bacterium]|nr:hypothetical protein [Gemmataceae bacterium]MCI0738396.1 hypothetical protein [Gemmataceae bacterium]